MPIDTFSKSQFEAALPVHRTTGAELWQSLGFVDGEYCYLLPVNELAAIMIRSSVGASGYSADTGKDSIRVWLVDPITTKPLGSKLSKHTTRLPGWELRTKNLLRTLYTFAKDYIRSCSCGGTVGVFKVKKDGPNKGKLFTSCSNFGCQTSRFTLLPDEFQK